MIVQERQMETLGIRLEKVIEENEKLKREFEDAKRNLKALKNGEVNEEIGRMEAGEYELVN